MTFAATNPQGVPDQVRVETVVLRLRRHGRRLTLPVVVLIVIAAAAGYWVGALPETWMNLAAAIGAAVVALVLGVGPLLAWLATRATVTTQRVIIRRGFFVQQRSEVSLARVREVRLRRGPLQRILGSGDIQLLVGAEAPIVLRDVPGPAVVVAALNELVEINYVPGAPFGSVPAAPSSIPAPSFRPPAMPAG